MHAPRNVLCRVLQLKNMYVSCRRWPFQEVIIVFGRCSNATEYDDAVTLRRIDFSGHRGGLRAPKSLQHQSDVFGAAFKRKLRKSEWENLRVTSSGRYIRV